MISITICCPEWSDNKHTWIPTFINHNVVSLIMSYLIWRHPSIFTKVAMSKRILLTVRFLDVSKFTTLMPLSFPVVNEKCLPCLLGHRNLLTTYLFVI
jgi:hypothetical protein